MVTHTGNRAQTAGPQAALIARARWFRVLSDPNRLEIISVLLTGPCSVSELVERTGLPRSRVSNHLACLRWCRFVHADRQGRRVVYTIADPRLTGLLDLAGNLVCDNAGHLATCERIGPDWV
jgi:ArsR family transcriptional regulator, cadmium/lead-responsive transcriptional repressor